MKQGKLDILELAREIKRQSETKLDYIAKGPALKLNTAQNSIALTNGKESIYGLTELSHKQLADRSGMPQKFYDDLRQNFPALLDHNVNTLLPAKNEAVMVRTLDSRVRAVLSNKYRILDNFDFLETILPVLLDAGFQVASCAVTDTRFYLKVLSPKITGELKVGEVVRAGFCFSNSEVGLGRMTAQMLAEIASCTNGMIFSSEYGFGRNHSGSRIEFSEAVESYFTAETRRIDDIAFFNKLRDVVKGLIGSSEGFQKALNRMRQAAEQKLPQGSTVKMLNGVSEVLTLNTQEKEGVLAHLLKSNDMTVWGLSSALTRYSQDVSDYDRATDFEIMGANVLELPRASWKVIENAATA